MTPTADRVVHDDIETSGNGINAPAFLRRLVLEQGCASVQRALLGWDLRHGHGQVERLTRHPVAASGQGWSHRCATPVDEDGR
jgi:hypothetical protein